MARLVAGSLRKKDITKWREFVEPHAQALADLRRGVDAAVKALSDEDIERLGELIDAYDDSNCWWAEYRVAPFFTAAILMEKRDRARRIERSGGMGSTQEVTE